MNRVLRAWVPGLLALVLVACNQNNNLPPVIGSFTPSPASGLAPLNVQFGWVVSDPNVDTVVCKLDPGDNSRVYTLPACTSGTKQSHTYDTPGTYTAKLTVEDSKGAKTDRTATVRVTSTNPPPPTNQNPTITAFSGTANNLQVAFNWDVSDPDAGDTLTCKLDVDNNGTAEYTVSNCAANKTQNHTYTQAGTYTAKLTVEDGKGGKAEKTAQVTVTSPPPPPPTNQPPTITSFTPSPASGDAPLTVSFGWLISDPNNDPLTCKVDINNDGTVDYTVNNCTSSSKQSHTYTQAGTYTAKLTVEDGKGGKAEKTATFTVNQPPAIASFTSTIASGNNNRLANFAWSISDPDGGALTCILDRGNGTSQTINSCPSSGTASFTYAPFVNSYTAKLTVRDAAGLQDERTVAVSIVPQTLTYTFSLNFKSNGNTINFTPSDITITLKSNQGGQQIYEGSFPYISGGTTTNYAGTLTINGASYTLNITAPDVVVTGTGTRDGTGKVTGNFEGTGVDAGTGTWTATPK